jgi:uncharacterized caspase-like protein
VNGRLATLRAVGRCWPLALLLGVASVATRAEDRALLIGIGRYQVAQPPLQGPPNDVQAVHEMLVGSFGFRADQIKELGDEKATAQGILDAIDQWLVDGTRSGDRVVLYYSGHGKQIADKSGDEKDQDDQDDQDEALVAYDAVADGTHWVLDDDIEKRMRLLQDRKVLALFDSCHSGTVTRGAFKNPDAKVPHWDGEADLSRGSGFPALDKNHQQEGGIIKGGGQTVAYFAVAPNQEAIDDTSSEPARPHGLFTDAFVEGVAQKKADANHDGRVSYTELLEFVRQRSAAYCQKNKSVCQNGLTPMLAIDDALLGLDILQSFGIPSAAPPATPATPVADILPHGNAAGLQLQMAPGPVIPLRTSVRYTLRSEHSGKLVIFDIDAAGKATQLFPNPYTPAARADVSWIEGGRPVTIPGDDLKFKIRAKEPLGKGKIVAVLIEDASVDTRDLIHLADGKGFAEIADPAAWMGQLRGLLNKSFPEADGKNRAIQWSITEADYEIVP